MKRLIACVFLLAAPAIPALAAEGMWQPHQMPELGDELRSLGLELEPESMTRLTEFPMAAVISLGGCTASFVSPDGLVITNHHCAVGSLQYNSTPENNILENGFLAATRADEVPAAAGQRVYVTVEARDVTERVVGALADDMAPDARYDAIEDKRKELIAECEKDPGHRCGVSSFHGGLQYWLTKRLELRDVRIVYAPARPIGRYGGDVDNWMWPRHTGDFTFYRAYVGPDGKPADFDESNVPYRPQHYLRVQPKGVDAEDLVMVVGYPGRTNRYRLAREVASRFTWYYPEARRLRLEVLEVIDRETAGREDAKIKYAITVAGLNNSTKNYQGMIDGYADSGMLRRKQDREAALQAWIDADPQREKTYGAVLGELNALIEEDEATRERDAVLGLLGRTHMLYSARRLYRLAREGQKPDAQRERGYQERDLQRFKQTMQRIDRRFDPQVDQAVLSYLLGVYRELPPGSRIPSLDRFLGLDDPGTDLDARLSEMYEKTELGDLDTRLAWMEARPKKFESSKDPFIRLAVAIYDDDRKREKEDEALSGKFMRVRPRLMDAMIAFEKGRDRPVYADANGTLRVTYGRVRGYSPQDGIVFEPFTRLEGIAEKDTGVDPFDSPAKQLELIGQQAYGAFALDGIDSVPVNFLSEVDTTGGNSGSPTINGRGELVGVLFDGTYDSINADWDFNVEKTRSIHVDIRYVLWVMRYVDEASALLEELGVGRVGS